MHRFVSPKARAIGRPLGGGPHCAAPGSLAVYVRNGDYVPRQDGPPVGGAGPKIANFDRVEWHTIPDAATVGGTTNLFDA